VKIAISPERSFLAKSGLLNQRKDHKEAYDNCFVLGNG
jgi:hypothetical protein